MLVMLNAGQATVRLNTAVVVVLTLSCTWNVGVTVEADVGVPAMTPVVGMLKPACNEPSVMLQV